MKKKKGGQSNEKSGGIGYLVAANALTGASIFVQFFAIITLLVDRLDGSAPMGWLEMLPWFAIVVLLPVLVQKCLANMRRRMKIRVKFWQEMVLTALVLIYCAVAWSADPSHNAAALTLNAIIIGAFVGLHWTLRYLYTKSR